MQYDFTATLEQHAVVACEGSDVWTLHDRALVTGSGHAAFVERWATALLPERVAADAALPDALDLPTLGARLADDFETYRTLIGGAGRETPRTSLLVAGVDADAHPFVVRALSSDGFRPVVERGGWRFVSLPFEGEGGRELDRLVAHRVKAEVMRTEPAATDADRIPACLEAFPRILDCLAARGADLGQPRAVGVSGPRGASVQRC